MSYRAAHAAQVWDPGGHSRPALVISSQRQPKQAPAPWAHGQWVEGGHPGSLLGPLVPRDMRSSKAGLYSQKDGPRPAGARCPSLGTEQDARSQWGRGLPRDQSCQEHGLRAPKGGTTIDLLASRRQQWQRQCPSTEVRTGMQVTRGDRPQGRRQQLGVASMARPRQQGLQDSGRLQGTGLDKSKGPAGKPPPRCVRGPTGATRPGPRPAPLRAAGHADGAAGREAHLGTRSRHWERQSPRVHPHSRHQLHLLAAGAPAAGPSSPGAAPAAQPPDSPRAGGGWDRPGPRGTCSWSHSDVHTPRAGVCARQEGRRPGYCDGATQAGV